MGRNSTGAVHHRNASRISLDFLTKNNQAKAINYNRVLTWRVHGEEVGSVTYTLSLCEDNRYLNLKYTSTHRYNGEKQELDYNIQIVGVPSNLGKGENLYFICPFTGKRCKILYFCYGSRYFKSREAYSHRIYYSSQMYSKRDRLMQSFHEHNERFENLCKKRINSHYRGKETKRGVLLDRLDNKIEELDRSIGKDFIRRFASLIS